MYVCICITLSMHVYPHMVTLWSELCVGIKICSISEGSTIANVALWEMQGCLQIYWPRLSLYKISVEIFFSTFS